MTSDWCTVQDARIRTIIERGTEKGGLYYVDMAIEKGHTPLGHRSSNHHLWMWHRRLSHPSLGYLKRHFPSLSNCNTSLNCESCVLAKSHKYSYAPSLTHSIKLFVLIHYDVWGLAPTCNTHGFSYYVLFVDDCTQMSWVYFLKHKSEVFDVFVKLYHMVLTQF